MPVWPPDDVAKAGLGCPVLQGLIVKDGFSKQRFAQLVEPAEAFILAGGRSTRMGRDKALLLLNGKPLIQYGIATLQELGLQPRLAGTRPDLATFAPVISDLRPGCGPLGGVEAALQVSSADLNLFLPVDVPLLPTIFLRWMLDRAAVTGALATIPLVQGRPQPLCSVLRRELLPFITRALDGGHFKVMDALAGSGAPDLFNVEAIAPIQRDWPVAPPLHRWFQNLNRPEDLAGVGGLAGFDLGG